MWSSLVTALLLGVAHSLPTAPSDCQFQTAKACVDSGYNCSWCYDSVVGVAMCFTSTGASALNETIWSCKSRADALVEGSASAAPPVCAAHDAKQAEAYMSSEEGSACAKSGKKAVSSAYAKAGVGGLDDPCAKGAGTVVDGADLHHLDDPIWREGDILCFSDGEVGMWIKGGPIGQGAVVTCTLGKVLKWGAKDEEAGWYASRLAYAQRPCNN